jgi:hypothetical protein
VTNFNKSLKIVQPKTLKDIAYVYIGVGTRDMHVGSKAIKPVKPTGSKALVDCWAVSLACLDHEGAGLLPDKMERAVIKESLLKQRSEQRPSFNLTTNDILLSNRGNYRVVGPLSNEQRYGIKELGMPWVPGMTMMLIRMKEGYELEASRLSLFLKSETARDALFLGIKENKVGQQIFTKARVESLQLPLKFFDHIAWHFVAVEERRIEALRIRQRIAKLADLRTTRAAWRHIESPLEWNFEKDEGLRECLKAEYGADGFDSVVALYEGISKFPPVFPPKFIEWAAPRLMGSNVISAMGLAHPISRRLAHEADSRIDIEHLCPSVIELLADIGAKGSHVGMVGEISGDLVARLAAGAKAEENEITDLKIWSPREHDITIASERARLVKHDFRVKGAEKPEVYSLSGEDECDYYHTLFCFVSDSSMSDVKQPMPGVSWQDVLRLLLSKSGRLVLMGDAKDIWALFQGEGNAPLVSHLEAAVLLPTALMRSRPVQKVVAIFGKNVRDEAILVDASLARSESDGMLLSADVRGAVCSQLSGMVGALPFARRARREFLEYKSWPGFLELMGRSSDLKAYSVESLTDELDWLEGRLSVLSKLERNFALDTIPPEEVTPRQHRPSSS